MDLFNGTLKPVQKVLEDADLTKKLEIVLVGGSTRIPKVQSLVKKNFSTVKNLARASTLTRLLLMALLSKLVFCQANRTQATLFSSMSILSPSALRLLEVS